MTWLAAGLSAVLGAVVGGAGALGLGLKCVRWYRISGFEGKSGFFVAGVTLAGIVGGLILGLIGARIAAAAGHPKIVAQLLGGVGLVAFGLALSALAALLYAHEP